jgi:hypothetical protein
MTDSYSILVVEDESESLGVVSRYTFDNWRLFGIAVFAGGIPSGVEFFDTAVFVRPAERSIGNAPKDLFRGLGIDNWDLALVKRFSIRDKGTVQLRWEAYNASARDPRMMRLAMRVIV